MIDNVEKSKSHTSGNYQHSLNLGNSLLDNLSFGIFLVDADEKVIFVNHALENFLNSAEERVLGKSYHELFSYLVDRAVTPDRTQRELFAAVSVLETHPQVDFSMKNRKMTYWVVKFFPMRDEHGVFEGWGGLLHDLSDVKEQVHLQENFLRDIVRNIRVPLASLKGYSAALLSHHQQWERDLVAEFLKKMVTTIDELSKQADRSLSLFRLKDGGFDLRPEAVDLLALLQHIVERSSKKWPEAQFELDYSEEMISVRVDQFQIEEVFKVIFQGAMQLGAADVLIKIHARLVENWAQVSFQSPGLVVGNEERQTIFGEKGAASTIEKKGANWNLFVCREVIEAHGGQIWIENPLPSFGEGTKILFTLPVLPEQSDVRISNHRVAHQEGVSKKILVVDNQPDSQNIVRSALQREGYRVDVTSTGTSALDIIQTSPPDLVLIDWVLPDISGLSVCRSIRRWSMVPIMMVTSKTSLDDMVTAFGAGVDDYLTKPFLSDELLVRVQALLRRQVKEQSLQEDEVFSRPGLRIDFTTQEVWVRGENVELTPIEYRLLTYMARHPRLVLSYERLIGEVWDSPVAGSRRSLFAHVSRLRQKIEANPEEPEYIHTRWGVGYVFMPNS